MTDFSDILHKGFDEFRRFVNPLISQRATLAREPIRIMGTADGLLVDSLGHTFEDFLGTQALSHHSPAITRALQAYLQTDIPNWYPSRVNPFSGRLARRLYERTGYDNAFLAYSGSDAVEEVRGAGFMAGIQLILPDHPWLSFGHFGFPEHDHRAVVAALLCQRLYPRGFFCFTCGHDWRVFRLQPRYPVPSETLDRFVEGCTHELRYIEGLC